MRPGFFGRDTLRVFLPPFPHMTQLARRAPVLHQVDAQNKPSSLHDGEFDKPDRTFDKPDRTFDKPDRTFDRTDRTFVRTDRTFVRTDRTVCTPLVT